MAPFGPWLMDVTTPCPKAQELEQLLSMLVLPPDASPVRATDTRGIVAADQVIGSGEIAMVPAIRLLGITHFARASGPVKLDICDVTRDDDGDLVVVVSGIREGEWYSVVYDGTTWRKQ